MRYIGSKTSSVKEIFGCVSPQIKEGSFCDPFGGTSTVGAYFKSKGFEVFTGDLLYFAHYIQTAKLSFNSNPVFPKLDNNQDWKDIFDVENHVENQNIRDGWFVENFAKTRKYFTIKNASHIELCWDKILKLKKEGLLVEKEYAYLIASLIESMDRVANTAGTYYAHLKNFSIKALRDFKFELIPPTIGKLNGNSSLTDALELIKARAYDVIYLDPPYNDRRYHGYYHLPEAIARGIKPSVVGKAGVCKFDIDIPSDFYSGQSAVKSLTRILKHADFKLLLFHYCPTGVIQEEKLDEMFSTFKSFRKMPIASLGYSTSKSKRKSTTLLYIVSNE